MVEKAQCSECPNSFEIIPPADLSYKIPREKPTTDDNIKRIYECPEGHRNTIYWEKKSFVIATASIDVEEGLSPKYTDPTF